ncbi:MAG: FHA domain-containing protein [Chloroflexus sp.]|jgi:pSer/pThr/pTyr-binding forkhead associated (FHA) protein|uniref:FHA domain-containing protein n=1 Tax=unclassified Chloroflexus TaxID=2633855 RepID=UPI0004DF6B93|nr:MULTISPECIES: FHA domain-containing protein [unclassified Chloroflexus]MBO9317182.1 FHA domain-containing protein [Chloroflexus sp.]MBO9337215.1 FHA domain-containing protein [Chloroflexus sp.]MBO9347236.1 FHA domain-containing protein [Chloroflexus sp.]MDN5271463.1 FHA domain-containing protein [Chloroflexus sp. MS-CIW-1]
MSRELTLIGVSGSRTGQQIVVNRRSMVIGSARQCDIVLYDRQVLERHAEIAQALERWFVTPLDHSALVALNGQRINSRQRLNHGDLLSIGSATFKVADR